MEVTRTNLDWARDFARAYRWALRKSDPQRCDELDADAIATGQYWIAPTKIPVEAAIELIEAVLSPKELAQALGFPVGTIYGWASKGLLKPADTDSQGQPLEPGAPAKYRVKDVLAVDGRRRARRLDIA